MDEQTIAENVAKYANYDPKDRTTPWSTERLDRNYMETARIFYEKMAIYSRDDFHYTKSNGFSVVNFKQHYIKIESENK